MGRISIRGNADDDSQHDDEAPGEEGKYRQLITHLRGLYLRIKR